MVVMMVVGTACQGTGCECNDSLESPRHWWAVDLASAGSTTAMVEAATGYSGTPFLGGSACWGSVVGTTEVVAGLGRPLAAAAVERWASAETSPGALQPASAPRVALS